MTGGHIEDKASRSNRKSNAKKQEEVTEDDKEDYYRKNRSEIIQKLSKWPQIPKKPVVIGMIVLLPIFVILFVIHWVFSVLEGLPGSSLIHFSDNYIINQAFMLGIVVIGGILLTTGTGRFVQTGLGFQIEKNFDNMISKLPLLGSIYKFTKVTSETVLLGGAEDLSQPVKIEVQGMRITAFKTGNKTSDGREIIFLPTSPNITTGFVLEVPTEDIICTDETGKEALTRTLSAGFGQDGRH